MDNDRFDLVADMDDVFGLDGRVAGEIVQRDVGRVLGAEVDFNLGGTDSHDGACYLISIIQSFEGLLEKLGKILLLCSFNFQFFAHFVVYLLNYPRRCRGTGRYTHSSCAMKKGHVQFIGMIDEYHLRAILAADHGKTPRIGAPRIPDNDHRITTL